MVILVLVIMMKMVIIRLTTIVKMMAIRLLLMRIKMMKNRKNLNQCNFIAFLFSVTYYLWAVSAQKIPFCLALSSVYCQTSSLIRRSPRRWTQTLNFQD